MIHARIRDFLFHGNGSSDNIEGNDHRGELARIQAASSNLLQEWQDLSAQHEAGKRALQESGQELSIVANRLEDAGIEGLKRKVIEEEYKRKLLEMASSIDELERLSTVIGGASATDQEEEKYAREIQAVVLRMLRSLPHRALPTSSQLFRHMQYKTKHMSENILGHFHTRFESLLEHNEGDSSVNLKGVDDAVAEGRHQGGDGDGWADFLDHSRSWLLAYVMIKLLPLIISASNSTVVESYQEALDEALMPMWGRYRFHLRHAAESGNRKQILWAFHYATSITGIFHGLCQHLKDSKELLQFFSHRDAPIAGESTSGSSSNESLSHEYKVAGPVFLLSKSTNFFKAHLAVVVLLLIDPRSAANLLGSERGGTGEGDDSLEDAQSERAAVASFLANAGGKSGAGLSSPSTTASFVMRVVEETLTFDCYQLGLLAQNIAEDDCDKSDDNANPSPFLSSELAVEVLCDSVELFAVWLREDVGYFRSRLTEAVGRRTGAEQFDEAFSGAFTGFSGSSDLADSAASDELLFSFPDSSSSHDVWVNHDTRGKQQFCYLSVFDTLSLFQLACQRYASLPAPAAAEFSIWVIEPLLAMMSALLLLQVRVNPLLCDLSKGQIPAEVRRAYRESEGQTYHMTPPLPLQRLRATVKYLNAALRATKSSLTGTQNSPACGIATEVGNYRGLWDQTHEWLPRDIASMNEVGLSHVKNHLFPQLVDMVMPEAQGPHATPAPLVGLVDALTEKRAEKRGTRGLPGEGFGSLGTSIDHMRAQAITLCTAIDKQYERALSLVERLER